MFLTAVVDTAIGLIFTFLTVSLVSSALTEALASWLQWRSKTLLRGVKDLVNDQDFKSLAKDLYNHALVNPLSNGAAGAQSELTHLPAYIDPNHFAAALIDSLKLAGDAPADIIAALDRYWPDPSPNPHPNQTKAALKGIVGRGAKTVEEFQNHVAAWFDSSMDRVSGVYKRNIQFWSFLIALAVVAAMNVSALQVGRALWEQPTLTRVLAAEPAVDPEMAIQKFEALGLPIGWGDANLTAFSHPAEGIAVVFGWLITAAATLFGAPFWFDTLQQFVRLKGSGPSPTEKKDDKGAAA
jgi:hypothetical protein